MFSKLFSPTPPAPDAGQPSQAQGAAPQAQPPGAVTPEQVQTNKIDGADPAASGVADPTNPDSGKSAANPLDAFKDLYQTTPTPEGVTPRLEVTDELLSKVVPSLDFTSGLSPEVQQGLNSGDPKAILAAIQQVGANAYKTSMQHNAALINDHLDKRFESFKPQVQASVDKTITSQALSSLPNANNPVIKAELDRVAGQLRAKFPTADNAWIATQTNTYLSELGKQLNGTSAEPAKQELPESVDFSKLLSEG